jgi:polar amino acid transport system substrate-binding protein
MKHLWKVIAIVLAFSLALSACGTTSGSHLDAIKKAGVIKVGTSADYPPFEYVDASGNKIGFDIELMQEIANRLGVKLEWVDMPFDSLVAGVQQGKIDASIAAFNYSEERDQVVDFTDAYYTSEDAFTVTEDSTIAITDPTKDLANLKIGVQTGTTQDSWLSDQVTAGNISDSNISRYDRVDQIALDLKSGRIDVMMSDAIPAEALAKQVGGLKVIYKGVLSSGPMNIVIPQGDTQLAKAINDILKQLKDEGFIDQLAVKYFAAQ